MIRNVNLVFSENP